MRELAILALLFHDLLAQDAYAPRPCGKSDTRECLNACYCSFCTTNQTLADGLLNGTIPPDALPRHDTTLGTCVDDDTPCPSKYITVDSAAVIAVSDGRACQVTLKGVIWFGSIAAAITLVVVLYCCYEVYANKCTQRAHDRKKPEYV